MFPPTGDEQIEFSLVSRSMLTEIRRSTWLRHDRASALKDSVKTYTNFDRRHFAHLGTPFRQKKTAPCSPRPPLGVCEIWGTCRVWKLVKSGADSAGSVLWDSVHFGDDVSDRGSFFVTQITAFLYTRSKCSVCTVSSGIS